MYQGRMNYPSEYRGIHGWMPQLPNRYTNLPMPQPMLNPSIESYCHMVNLLSQLIDKRASIQVIGVERPYENMTLKRVEHGILYVEDDASSCIIPVKAISAVCISKECAANINV